MLAKHHQRSINTPEDKMNGGIRCLEQSIKFQQELTARQKCPCNLCKSDIKITLVSQQLLGQPTFRIGKTLKKILDGLTSPGTPGLKLFIPDICFLQGDTISVFSTQHRQNRFIKLSGTISIKNLYHTMLRLRISYKNMLQENFTKNLLDTVDPKFMHEKYMNQLLPTHFHDGIDSEKLKENRNQFKEYILHNNSKYTISAIQEHKVNENQPFCVIYYNDGSSQLYSQRQFETLTVLKVPSDAVYIQSYIKEKKETLNIFTSSYTQFSLETRQDLFDLAETEVLVLIGGINKYSDRYKDLEELEDNDLEMMKNQPDDYVIYSTYRIVHYLAMVSRIYVKKININWILNDMGVLYIQNVFDVEVTDVSERPIKFRLPPKQSNVKFYKDSEKFLKLYQEMQTYRQAKRLRIREELLVEKKQKQKQQREKNSKASIADLLSEKSTIDRTRAPKNKKLEPITRLSRTFEVEENIVSGRKRTQKSMIGGRLLRKSTIDNRYQNGNMSHSIPLKMKDNKKLRAQSFLEKYHF